MSAITTVRSASQKQIELLRKLGYAGDAQITAQAASEEISALLQQIDVEQIKRSVPIDWLVSQRYTVVSDGGGRLTTEEHDSLKIWPRQNNFTWYSKSGKDGKALGGSVIDWYMHAHSCDQGTAIIELSALQNGGAAYIAPPRPIEPVKPRVEEWRNADWQRKAAMRVEQAIDRLYNSPDGEPGLAYLENRGIRPDMALAYDIGFGPAWHPQAKCEMPALWLPWRRDRITAVQYRFLTDDKGLRFAQMAGGVRYLFGLQHCMNPADYAGDEDRKLKTLILVEGELNAISIMQAVYGLHPCDVVSYGPQSNINNPAVARMAATVAERYQRVIVWADEPTVALAAIGHLPQATPMRSPGGKDANDLLRAGVLGEFIFRLLERLNG